MVTLQAAIAVVALTGVGPTVLLDFYSDHCPPCKAMEPTVRKLEAEGYPVQRVNVDLPQNKPLVEQFRIRQWPQFVMVVGGQEVDRKEGGTTLYQLEQMCKRGATPPPAGQSPAMFAANTQAAPPTPISTPFPPSNVGTAANMGATTNVRSVPGLSGGVGNTVGPANFGGPQFGSVEPTATAVRPAAGVSDADLLAASVRLRVEDRTGHDCASGTIIDNRGGRALILTCGHIFRESQGKGAIEVDLFGPNGQQRVRGQMYSYDLTRDVGLVVIEASSPLAVARVAPPGYCIRDGDPVASVGCNFGDVPTVRHSRINSRDKFLGPPNLQVAGEPMRGRSGGGLFSREGYVIGVCNASDPSDKEGLFAALPSIFAELDRKNTAGDDLSFVYKSPGGSLATASVANAAPAPVNPASNVASSMPGPNGFALARSGEGTSGTIDPPTQLPPQEQAAMDEIHRRAKEGWDVTVIAHPRDNPNARNEVFMLDRASSGFVRQLSAEARPSDQLQPTSLALPKPRKILLEWSAEDEARRGEQHKSN